MTSLMRVLVEDLCSEKCAGRAPGTEGGLAARQHIVKELSAAGYVPEAQLIPGSHGANVIADMTGTVDRWVIVGAHYDHLGVQGGETYWGADDNAAGVVVMLFVAQALKRRPPKGRGVIFAAFDAEEPPHFLTRSMGSEYFAENPWVPLEKVDMMLCMDLVGHAIGPEGMPDEVRQTLFALGAERSAGTAEHVDRLARAVPGLVVRRADAEVIPPMSDYDAFWKRKVPFLFLSCGRSRIYHTPDDTPDRLDYAKMSATASWLERFVRETCERPAARVPFLDGVRDDRSTLLSLIDVMSALLRVSPVAAQGRALAQRLLAACDREGKLAEVHRAEMRLLASMLEHGLS